MRLIDADALIKSMKSHTVEDNGLTNDYKAGLTDSIRIAVALAENAPTIDAVEVVRCRDCRFSRPTKAFDTEFGLDCTYERGDWKRVYGFSMVSANGFCDEGKRREKNNGKTDYRGNVGRLSHFRRAISPSRGAV